MSDEKRSTQVGFTGRLLGFLIYVLFSMWFWIDGYSMHLGVLVIILISYVYPVFKLISIWKTRQTKIKVKTFFLKGHQIA